MGLSEFLKDWFGTGVKKLPPGIEATVRANIPNWSKLSVKKRREEAKKIDARYVEDQLAMQEILAEAHSTPRPADYGIKWDFLAKLSELEANVAEIESKQPVTLEDMERKERLLANANRQLSGHLANDPFQAEPSGTEFTAPSTNKLVAWQRVMLECWPEIKEVYKQKPQARDAMRWLKNNGPRDVIPEHQPLTEALAWINVHGELKSVNLHTIQNTISRWKREGRIPR